MRTPAAATQGSSSSGSSPSGTVRNIFFSSRPQVHPMNHSHGSPSKEVAGSSQPGQGQGQGQGQEIFQRRVGELFQTLVETPDELLSLAWLRDVVETALGCESEFKSLVPRPKPPLSKVEEKIAADFFERSVKALDLCNAIRDGIEQVRLWQKHVEIVLCALDGRQRSLGEPQFRRARKALGDLALAMAAAVDDKDSPAGAAGLLLLASRNRSFGRPSQRGGDAPSHFRSLSWSVSRSWSAGRQLQAMGSNLVAPKGTEVAASNGLAAAAYTMNNVTLFALWALVAAIPCQDRGLQTHFSVPRNFVWAAPLVSIHDKVMEESRKRDRRSSGSVGLLKEIHQISTCVRHLSDLAETVKFPLAEQQDQEVRRLVLELMHLWAALKDGLDPLEKQVRELFHRIVRTRTEAFDSFSRPSSQD